MATDPPVTTDPEPPEPYGMHPFFDYGYKARLGTGRVLWDSFIKLHYKKLKQYAAISKVLISLLHDVYRPGGRGHKRARDHFDTCLPLHTVSNGH